MESGPPSVAEDWRPKCSLWRCQLQKRWGLTVRLLSAIRIIWPRLKQFFTAAVYWKTNGLKTARLSRDIGFHYNKERPKCFKSQHDPMVTERDPLTKSGCLFSFFRKTVLIQIGSMHVFVNSNRLSFTKDIKSDKI